MSGRLSIGVLLALTLAYAIDLAPARGAAWEVESPPACDLATRCRASTESYVLEPRSGGSVPRVAGGVGGLRAGDPDLPVLVRVVPVPSQCEGRVVIEACDFAETNGVDVAPVAGAIAEAGSVEPSFRSAAYAADAWWPPEPIRIDVADRGTQRWARVVYYPFQWNPVRRVLRWNRSVAARLEWSTATR